MLPSPQGALRLFRVAGVEVFLHWSWFVVALIEVQRRGQYRSLAWNVAEYLALFALVTLHELGHSLACRQVGGHADRVVLWPLGGVAYVDPPQRPGAILWSIAAGPLVNVLLAPVLVVGYLVLRSIGAPPDLLQFARAVIVIDVALLVFNVLPVYPLDGGQILRALLWYVLGKARSLVVASGLGFVGVLGLGLLAWHEESVWIGVITAFVASSCWRGLQQARLLTRVERIPRRPAFACPSCRSGPPLGPFWACPRCQARLDAFEADRCPACDAPAGAVSCIDCGRAFPPPEWVVRPGPTR